MAMRVVVAAQCAEGRQRDDATGTNVFALAQNLERLADGLVCGARQQSQQAALTLEQAAQSPWDRERPVSVRYGSQDLARQLLGKKYGALGLATRAEIPGAT